MRNGYRRVTRLPVGYTSRPSPPPPASSAMHRWSYGILAASTGSVTNARRPSCTPHASSASHHRVPILWRRAEELMAVI